MVINRGVKKEGKFGSKDRRQRENNGTEKEEEKEEEKMEEEEKMKKEKRLTSFPEAIRAYVCLSE